MNIKNKYKKIAFVLLGMTVLFYQLHGIRWNVVFKNVGEQLPTQEILMQKSYGALYVMSRSPLFWTTAGGGILSLILLGFYKQKIKIDKEIGKKEEQLKPGKREEKQETKSTVDQEQKSRALQAEEAARKAEEQKRKEEKRKSELEAKAKQEELRKAQQDLKIAQDKLRITKIEQEIATFKIGAVFAEISATIDSISENQIMSFSKNINYFLKNHSYFGEQSIATDTRESLIQFLKTPESFFRIYYLLSRFSVSVSEDSKMSEIAITYSILCLLSMFSKNNQKDVDLIKKNLNIEDINTIFQYLLVQVSAEVAYQKIALLVRTKEILDEFTESGKQILQSLVACLSLRSGASGKPVLITKRAEIVDQLIELINGIKKNKFNPPENIFLILQSILFDTWLDLKKIAEDIDFYNEALRTWDSLLNSLIVLHTKSPEKKEEIFEDIIRRLKVGQSKLSILTMYEQST